VRAGAGGQGVAHIRNGDGEVAQEFLAHIGMTEEQYEGMCIFLLMNIAAPMLIIVT
jgi:hypothetical protein